MGWLDYGAWLGFGLLGALLVVFTRAAVPRARSGTLWTVIAGLAGATAGGLVGRALVGKPGREGAMNVVALLLAGFFAAAFAVAVRRWQGWSAFLAETRPVTPRDRAGTGRAPVS